jgi:hypothetical protein
LINPKPKLLIEKLVLDAEVAVAFRLIIFYMFTNSENTRFSPIEKYELF